MAESTIRDLFRSLENTIHERLRVIEDVIRATSGDKNSRVVMPPSADVSVLESMQNEIRCLSAQVAAQQSEIRELRAALHPTTPEAVKLLPLHPLEGLEIIPKREVVIPPPTYEDRLLMNKRAREVLEVGEIGSEDRLLMNKKARKALEAEEMGELALEEHPTMDEEEGEEEVVEEVAMEEETESPTEEVTEEVIEEEQSLETDGEEDGEGEEEEVNEEDAEEVEEEEEAEAEEEGEEVQLEEFEYKGSTYYRDAENNVFMTDEDGELVEDPIGRWNEAKQRIVKLPTAV